MTTVYDRILYVCAIPHIHTCMSHAQSHTHSYQRYIAMRVVIHMYVHIQKYSQEYQDQDPLNTVAIALFSLH